MQYFTVKQVAKYFKVSESTIRRIIKNGTLEANKVSPHLTLISQKSINKYISDNRIIPDYLN